MIDRADRGSRIPGKATVPCFDFGGSQTLTVDSQKPSHQYITVLSGVQLRNKESSFDLFLFFFIFFQEYATYTLYNQWHKHLLSVFSDTALYFSLYIYHSEARCSNLAEAEAELNSHFGISVTLSSLQITSWDSKCEIEL